MRDRLQRLTEALRRSGADEWVAIGVRRLRAVRTPGRALSGEEVELGATLWRDLRRGRGGAFFTVRDDADAEVGALIAAAMERAAGNLDAPWRLPPPAAPARVDVAEALAVSAEAAAAEVASDLAVTSKRAGGPALASSRVAAEASEHAVAMSTGFDHAWAETRFEVDAALSPAHGAGAEELALRVRRRADLDLPAVIAAAITRAEVRRRAAATAAGRYDVVLRAGALAGARRADRGDHGWWAPIVAQASAALARQGLARYRVGQSIYGAVRVTGDRLDVRSDGTLPWAWDSAPLGSLGEPVRAFDLVAGGVAAGVALDLREAGRRGLPANGGVRNLIIGPGSTPLEQLRAPGARPRLEVAELAWLETNPRTGAFVAEIGLATLASGGTEAPVAGGAFRGNLFDLLAAARLSTETATTSGHRGPAAIRFDDLDLS